MPNQSIIGVAFGARIQREFREDNETKWISAVVIVTGRDQSGQQASKEAADTGSLFSLHLSLIVLF